MRYFEIGGHADPFEIDGLLHELLPLSAHERDVLAHALNERLDELQADESVPYTFNRDTP